MTTRNAPHEVYAVITLGLDGRPIEVEFLSEAPQWDLEELNQVCFVGNVNGGDSVPFRSDLAEAGVVTLDMTAARDRVLARIGGPVSEEEIAEVAREWERREDEEPEGP